jgi:hypothetical protein
MAFDLYACYPRATLAASQAAYRRAVADQQLDHSDEALPAANVTPRLTTAEALALVASNAERGSPAADLVAWEVLESGARPTRKYEARFRYADGSLHIFP